MKNLVKALVANLRSGRSQALVSEIRRRSYSDWLHYGLSRNLSQPFQNPYAKIPFTVRILRKDDIPALLDLNAPQISDRGPYVRMHRLNFIEAGIGTCYVGVTEKDEPCYMQWLITAKDHAQTQKYFHGIFPVLREDEALLEFAFTPERWQGKGIMPAAMALIAEKAGDVGANRVITFVDSANVPALRGCKKAGFMPYVARVDKWRLFRRRCLFTDLPAGTPYPFDAAKSLSSGSRESLIHAMTTERLSPAKTS